MNHRENRSTPPNDWGRRTALLGLGVFAVGAGMLLLGCGGDASRLAARPSAEAAPIAVRIEAPGAQPVRATLPWRPAMTVEDALRELAAAEPDGPWGDSRWRGAGASALLLRLSGRDSGPDGLFWQFERNGRYAERGAGATTLDPGDDVLWRLSPEE